MEVTPNQNKCLFQNEDKSPMVFCLRPCAMKKEVKGHIVEGGGLCFQNIIKVPTEYKRNALLLVPDGETSSERDALRASYVIDCVNEGKLLPKEDYRLHSKSVPNLNMDGQGEGRMSYSKTEDINILLYVRDNSDKGKNKLTGNAFWKNLENLNMFQLHGRSWQSLKDRYLKHLKGRESEYPLEGRFIGPLPMPPKPPGEPISRESQQITQSKTGCPESIAETESSKGATGGGDSEPPGTFLAEVEGRRNDLSPGLSRKEYHVLINDFVSSLEKTTKLSSKTIHKVLFKCNGNEEVARYYLLNGKCPEGFYMLTDEEDKILLKCLLNPNICDEVPAKRLADKLGEEVVLDRAAALIGVSRKDFEYMQQIPLPEKL